MTDARAGATVNELVAGKYRLSRMIGRGGMGSVWEGVHATLGSRVAIKFIDAEYAESPEALSRFENEAHAAAKLRSKYVVEVYDHGVTADGRPYIVMEFLNGEPLDRRLETHGRLDLVPTAMLMQQVSRALARAHAAGIVHRDLKPENIFLVRDEEDGTEIAKVVDFGIAKFTDRGMGVSSSTRTGSVLGTPFYMSPEQARGLRAVDARSDIWSMGVIAFRCLTGRLPFEGEAVGDLLVKICTGPTPVPTRLVAGLPPEFDSFIARGLAKEPDQRFQSAQELADNLAAIAGLPVQTGPVPYLGDGRAYAGGPTPAGAHTPGGRVWTPGTGPQPPTVAGVAASVERRSSRGGLIAVLVVGFILLAIGVGVAAKLALLDAPPAEASSEAPTAGPPPIPELAAAPATERTTAAPSEPAAVVVAPAAAESSTAASAQPEKVTAEPPPKRVAPVARPRPKPEAPKAVVAAPLPARPLPPVSKPPPPKPKTPDVGY